MPKHKNNDILTRIQDVSQLMAQDKSDAEIMSLLKLPQRTLTRYKQRICEQNKQIWAKLVEEQVYGELIKLKNSLESTYQISLAMCQDPECKSNDRIEALHCKDDARLSIVQLLSEYSEFKRKVSDEDNIENNNEIKPYVKRMHS
ncbi:MAG: hypothetical protein WA421_07075 [Nitrososphaeraceae archaeon]